MSRGPGRQQRRILAALKKVPAFCLAELAGGKYEQGGDKWVPSTRSEKVSLLRAAPKLAASGKIKIKRYMHGGHDSWHLVVARRNYVFPEWRHELLDPYEFKGQFDDGKTPCALRAQRIQSKR